jgi:hypothetical protein
VRRSYFKLKMQEIHNNFISFVKYIWQDFIEGSHHKKISEKFNLLPKNKIKKLIINIPPRHSKSSFASFLLPAWMLGCTPNLKITQIVNDNENPLFFSKTKKLIDKPSYKKIFKTRLKKISEGEKKLHTEQGGEYYLTSFGSEITDLDVDLVIIDDPHSEKDSLNPDRLKSTFEWYRQKLLKILNPNTIIVLVMTRCNINDLTGQLIKIDSKTKEDKWEILKLPVITASQKPLWPEFWKLDELKKIKDSVSEQEWNFKWMQD